VLTVLILWCQIYRVYNSNYILTSTSSSIPVYLSLIFQNSVLHFRTHPKYLYGNKYDNYNLELELLPSGSVYGNLDASLDP